ncbi:MAG: hypothetical protein DIU76_09130, partial [Bacillota bacterium]
MLRRRRPVTAFVAVFSISLFVLLISLFGWTATAAAPTRPRYYSNQVAVLLYHSFERPPDGPITVTRRQFDEHIRALKTAGFQFISAEQFRRWKQGQGSIPPNAVLLTIDDGMKEIHSVALPILKQHQVPAVAFVVYYRIDRDPNTVSGQAVRELVANGVEVQSHTYDMHRRVIRKGDGAEVAMAWVMDEAQIRADMARARQRHGELLGDEPDMLAYPYGAYTPAFIRAAQAEGIRFAFTTKTGLVSRSTPNMELPRFNTGIRGMTGKQVVDLLRRYAPAAAATKPSGYFVGGGLYRSKAEAQKAAQRFTRLTGYRMYVTHHPKYKP